MFLIHFIVNGGKNVVSFEDAEKILKEMLGPSATFREGQWQAINEIVNKKSRLLLVQRTGWGKSIVYFMSAYFIRKELDGITLLISPLLSLMRNQIKMAEKIGINAKSINSSNTNNWDFVKSQIRKGYVDVLLISPERLASQEFQRLLRDTGISFLVIDEAHCVSDWGHDFRPDYKRIVRIVSNLPKGSPMLATTATANDRVVADIEEQLGPDLVTIRGPLVRESLRIQAIYLKDQAAKMAWLADNVPKMDKSGIIYCSTKAHCERVARWLRSNDILAEAYHAGMDSETRKELEQKLLNNEVKALVSTVALGMGFDKPDLGFVIHFQRPGSLVAYYQQIGRAGRNINEAYAILLSGEEDDEIQEYFIENAFPAVTDMRKVLTAIEESNVPLKEHEILEKINIKSGELKKCLKILAVDGAISKSGSGYFRTPNPWNPDIDKWKKITRQRMKELEDRKKFCTTKKCLTQFITEKLNDPYSKECGKCANCNDDYFTNSVDEELWTKAVDFLKKDFLSIIPRKQFPDRQKIPTFLTPEKGFALSVYGDSGWGKIVKEDKYIYGEFRDSLVDAAADLVKKYWNPSPFPELVLAVPSLRRPNLVPNFAERLAEKLGIEFKKSIVKIKDTPEQKSMHNSVQQFENVVRAFEIVGRFSKQPILLVDDLVDSRWTFTVLAYLLKKNGAGAVYPLALAASWEGGNG